MATNIHPTTQISPSPMNNLLLGRMEIEGKFYKVSIESSESLVSKDTTNTLEKIQYLVDLHLNPLKSLKVDTNAMVLQELDSKALYYNLNNESKFFESKLITLDEKTIPHNFLGENIQSISDIYESIINSVTESEEDLIIPEERNASTSLTSLQKPEEETIDNLSTTEQKIIDGTDSPSSDNDSSNIADVIPSQTRINAKHKPELAIDNAEDIPRGIFDGQKKSIPVKKESNKYSRHLNAPNTEMHRDILQLLSLSSNDYRLTTADDHSLNIFDTKSDLDHKKEKPSKNRDQLIDIKNKKIMPVKNFFAVELDPNHQRPKIIFTRESMPESTPYLLLDKERNRERRNESTV